MMASKSHDSQLSTHWLLGKKSDSHGGPNKGIYCFLGRGPNLNVTSQTHL